MSHAQQQTPQERSQQAVSVVSSMHQAKCPLQVHKL